MEKRVILCISREHGSGGRLIGEKLAEKLNIPCYNKKILEKTSEASGLSEKLIASVDEQPVTLASMGFPRGIRSPYREDFDARYYTLNDKVFDLEAQTIRKIAAEGSCIMIGRAAAAILKDDPDMISVFICAALEERIRRVMRKDGCDHQTAKHVVSRLDKNRASYHNARTDTKWGYAAAYDLSISTSRFTTDEVVASISFLLK